MRILFVDQSVPMSVQSRSLRRYNLNLKPNTSTYYHYNWLIQTEVHHSRSNSDHSQPE